VRVGVYNNTTAHQERFVGAMASGIAAHGDTVKRVGMGAKNGDIDCVVTWGWRNAKAFWARKVPVLVLERGYLGKWPEWISAGWDGLNGRAKFPASNDNGRRFGRFFCLDNYRPDNGRAIVFGQVRGDAALQDVNIDHWYVDTMADLLRAGWEVVFRPHPDEMARRAHRPDYGVPLSIDEPLADALRNVSLAVGWNTSATVEAVCSGVPVVTFDKQGSIAGPVAATKLERRTPDRGRWASDLAWKQYSESELASGYAWAKMRGYVDGGWRT